MNKLLIIYGIKETASNSKKSNNKRNHINKNPSRNKSVIHNRILTVTMLVFIIILVVNACLADIFTKFYCGAQKKQFSTNLQQTHTQIPMSIIRWTINAKSRLLRP
uniref:Uncharacterized protein n=1 Tax=Glossina austeni TaxID=7395 RepID=A0A1A9VIH2_GLOAU